MLPELNDLVDMACRAGEILRAGYGLEHQIRHKGLVDLVTEVDHQSEKLLIDSIRQKFPGHRILAEESGALEGSQEHCWYIDPLDGTLNYAHGLPIFCVSIAYAYRGEVRLGVVYDPTRDQSFQAERGSGAYLGEERLRVSPTTEMIQSLLVTGFPYDAWENRNNNLDHFSRFTRLSQGVRRLGSAALDLCYIAAGWLDGFWEISISPWDIAAGGLICEEAGGIVTKLSGDRDYLTPPCSVLAANPILHPHMLELLKE